VHGFLAGPETAHSVLDAVRAARAIPGAAAGTRMALWGESQGGHATLWTAAEAHGYAPELTLVGAAAAAPPTDLLANLAFKGDPSVKAMFTAFVTYSWSRRYGAPLAGVFGPVNRGVVARLAQNNCVTLDKKPRLGTVLGVLSVRGGLKGKDLGTIEPWAGLARANTVVPRAVPGPVLIAQSGEDPLVSAAVTRAFARGLCRQGRAVRYVVIPGGDHAASARNSADETLDWIDARFAGKAPANDCRKI
jgi:acetyl esterase/lipase